MSFLGVLGAVEEVDLCLQLDSLSLPAEVPVRAVPEVLGASNMLTLLAVGIMGGNLARYHFLFNSSPSAGDVFLALWRREYLLCPGRRCLANPPIGLLPERTVVLGISP